MFNLKKTIKIGGWLLMIAATFLVAHFTLAQVNVGTNEIGNTIALGATNPITTATRIINIIMIFLGIIAVGIVVFAGFKWMTSEGNEEKVEEAKKILKAGLIGLVIVLAAWGIVIFILSQFLGATGSSNPNNPTGCTGPNCNLPGGCTGAGCLGSSCDSNLLQLGCQAGACNTGLTCDPNSNCTCRPGAGTPCGTMSGSICSITNACASGLTCDQNSCTCQPCTGSNCNTQVSCNSNLGGGTCNPQNSLCSNGYCDSSTCLCKTGGFGDPCNSDSTGATCAADNTRCDASQALTCDSNSCTCQGSPVITDVSPAGGFCSNNHNHICTADADCGSGGTCDTTTPNGTPGNIISIHGYNFGNATSSQSSMAEPKTLLGKIEKLFGLYVPVKTANADTPPGQVVFLGNPNDPSDDVVADVPSTVNANCTDSWTNNEIIVLVPAGAKSGPIKVVNNQITAPGLANFDTTSDANGPQIPDFLLNNITRPGLCKINPLSGARGGDVNYFGVNLGGTGFFGNYQTSVAALNSTFAPGGQSGQANIPNITPGDTSTFVNHNQAKSNYLVFRKFDVPVGPAISSFDPPTGPPKQYVTIYGSGFGNSQGTGANANKVYFSASTDNEANYSFPAICADSLWSDNQVIVKVPTGLANGAYQIKMKLGSNFATSSSNFIVNSNLPLSPSLCKIKPDRGPANAPVKLYGEYFGTTSITAIARFYNNKNVTGPIADNGDGAQRLDNVKVPLGALTGRVAVVNSHHTPNLVGNGLNFAVGACSTNNDCGGSTPVCCPFGTPTAGECAISLLDPTNGCYANIPNSVFEWTFGGNSNCNILGQQACQSNANCGWNPATSACGACTSFDQTTCQDSTNANCCWNGSCQGIPTGDTRDSGGNCVSGNNSYSCAQNGNGTCAVAGYCPNSPGQCSSYPGNQLQTVGTCDSTCNTASGCAGDVCHYDTTLNKCILTGQTCSLSTTISYVIGSSSYDTTKTCDNSGRWEITIGGSCPSGWTNIGGNKCTEDNSTCNICASGLNCLSGQCASNTQICSSGATCDTNSSSATHNKCLINDHASCDCCCQIGHDTTDCCAPLTCGGTCGSGSGFGHCGGCLDVPQGSYSTTTEAHDAACNCANSSGKYCKDDGHSGYCDDCTGLTQGDCINHASACCWDDKSGICRGGNGTDITSNPSDTANYGHCAYYGCAGNNCAAAATTYATSSSVGACWGHHCTNNTSISCATSNDCIFGPHTYNSTSTCATSCGNYCSSLTSAATCKAASNCCYDESNPLSPKCTSGTKISYNSGTQYYGICAHYTCDNSDPPQCQPNPVANVPLGQPLYNSTSTCTALCPGTNSGLGLNCESTTTAATCNTNVCSDLFGCRDASGNVADANTTPGACGFCCCDPLFGQSGHNASDTCKVLDPTLTCESDRGPCSGGSRGLCCGCKQDSDCGSADITSGCSSDSCCRPRPSVASTTPLDQATDICRNALVSVSFDQKMDTASLANNILLLEADGSDPCPTGSTRITLKSSVSTFAKVYNSTVNILNKAIQTLVKVFDLNFMALASTGQPTCMTCFPPLPPPASNFCSIPGAFSYDNNAANTVFTFKPSGLLAPDKQYFVVVKGQDITASSTQGVLNTMSVGLNSTGYQNAPFVIGSQNFPGAYVWSFTTLDGNDPTSGVCAVDHVKITPPSYIFNVATNDLNENDLDATNPTFDTKADKDKVYSVQAYSAAGQPLQPVGDYSWTWSWAIPDNIVSNPLTMSSASVGLSDDQTLVSIPAGLTDNTVHVQATLNMDSGNTFTSGNGTSALATTTIFICNNPWPPIVNQDNWQPFSDQTACNPATGLCNNFNYGFYYCRDTGDPNVLLPALVTSGNGLVNIGPSSRLVCSNDRSKTCTQATAATDCGADNFCIWDILRETYFFRSTSTNP